MKYWMDTEFIERPYTIDLISIGLVAEDGREFYAESSEVDWTKASHWTLETVRPQLAGTGMPREYIGYAIREFIHAAALLRDRGIEATYLVVGGGVRSDAFFRTLAGRTLQRLDLARNYNTEARELVAELGLEHNIRFMAFTPEPGVLYRASDVVVSPSQGPEIGRPMLEGAGLQPLLPKLAILSVWGIASFVVALKIFRWQ